MYTTVRWRRTYTRTETIASYNKIVVIVVHVFLYLHYTVNDKDDKTAIYYAS